MGQPECPVQECRHVRDLKKSVDRLENLLYLAIGIGIINLGGMIF